MDSLQPLENFRTETVVPRVSTLSSFSLNSGFPSSSFSATAAAGTAERNQFVRDVRAVAVKVISEARDECTHKVAEATSSALFAWHELESAKSEVSHFVSATNSQVSQMHAEATSEISRARQQTVGVMQFAEQEYAKATSAKEVVEHQTKAVAEEASRRMLQYQTQI